MPQTNAEMESHSGRSVKTHHREEDGALQVGLQVTSKLLRAPTMLLSPLCSPNTYAFYCLYIAWILKPKQGVK